MFPKSLVWILDWDMLDSLVLYYRRLNGLPTILRVLHITWVCDQIWMIFQSQFSSRPRVSQCDTCTQDSHPRLPFAFLRAAQFHFVFIAQDLRRFHVRPRWDKLLSLPLLQLHWHQNGSNPYHWITSTARTGHDKANFLGVFETIWSSYTERVPPYWWSTYLAELSSFTETWMSEGAKIAFSSLPVFPDAVISVDCFSSSTGDSPHRKSFRHRRVSGALRRALAGFSDWLKHWFGWFALSNYSDANSYPEILALPAPDRHRSAQYLWKNASDSGWLLRCDCRGCRAYFLTAVNGSSSTASCCFRSPSQFNDDSCFYHHHNL